MRRKWLAFPVFLAVAAGVLLPASSGHGQNPLRTAIKGTEGQVSPASEDPFPATEEEIDRKIGQIRARLDELRSRQATGQDNAAGSGRSPDESAEWRRLNLQVAYFLESREQALKDLKTLLREARGASSRSPWRGVSGNPPYPLAVLSGLYDQILALRGEIDTLEIQREIREANVKSFLKAREESGKRLRQAEELLTKSAGRETAGDARWSRDLARLRDEVNSEGALAGDMAQYLAFEKVRIKREELRLHEEQYRSAEASSPLTGNDLDRILAELEERRKEREKLLVAAIQEEGAAKRALEKAMAGGPKTAGEAERTRMETAASRIEVHQGLLRLLNFEESHWQDRYRLDQVEDLVELRKKRAEVKEGLRLLGSWKEVFGRSSTQYAPLVLSETEKLRSGTLSKEEEETVRSRVSAYEERRKLWVEAVQTLNRTERVVTRWKWDLDYRVEHASTAARARETGKSLFGVFRKLWNTELYVAEETTVLQGQKIVRPFSVTAGKVVKALIILLAGLWATRKLGNLMKRHAAKRFGMDDSRTNQLERKWTFFSFLALLAFSLALVNIPLAVFAFFGGILAIGIGFGAQHLIGNFFSSVILMFDRTISVGDIVEMEKQLGRVVFIGLRSSRIRRLDGVEVLVPNSHFLEQKVINWSRSDQRVRYEIAVGVTYGSPTQETAGRILAVVREDARVLAEPEPMVLFESFGNSALMFRAFFWLALDPDRDNRVVCSDLRHRISKDLDQAGILVAFPQRDVHLDTKGPIEVKVLPGDGGGRFERQGTE